jgi:hypothetical protein
MSQSPPPEWRPGPGAEHPPWTGAPPPYPPPAQPGPPPSAPPRTGYPRALGATAIGAAVQLLLLVVLAGPPGSARAFGAVIGGMILPIALGSLVLWLIARKRAWPFWLLAVLGVVLYFVFRLVATAGRFAGAG